MPREDAAEGRKVRERPIIFSGEMVRAILAGRKTQTRRVVKITLRTPGLAACLQPHDPAEIRTHTAAELCPFGAPGDRLWVRETWAVDAPLDQVRLENEDAMGPPGLGHGPYFKTDRVHHNAGLTWRSPIHMPRWASRITLEIAGVRVERLQDISREDAIAEGLLMEQGLLEQWWRNGLTDSGTFLSPIVCYSDLWDRINGAGSWERNPWVWALTFRRIDTTAA